MNCTGEKDIAAITSKGDYQEDAGYLKDQKDSQNCKHCAVVKL